MSTITWLYMSYLRSPDHPIKGRVLNQIERLLPRDGIPYRTPGDIWMRLHPSKIWDRHLLGGGRYQAALCEFMRRNIRAGDIAAVAGVSFGQQLVVASRAAGPSGVVVGCDPHPAALIRTRDNLTLNDLASNVRLVAAALGDSRGAAPIEGTIREHVGEGSLIKPAGEFPYYTRVETLPDVLADLKIDRLDCLFLDVIGYEIPILKGLREPYFPGVMTIAVHPWVAEQTKIGLSDFQSFLSELGYSTFTLDGQKPTSISDLRECQLVCLRSDNADFLEYDPGARRGVWA